jgi:hypothetical protein
MSIALDLANALHRFNAKERNFLMRFALLGETNPGPLRQSVQWVHENFFEALRTALAAAPAGGESHPKIVLSEAARCVYAAMDYHLDWLHAALTSPGPSMSMGQTDGIESRERVPNKPDATAIENVRHDVMGTVEDIDLALVIEDGTMAYLVLIEAKGESSFSRSQLASKLSRLKLILDSEHALRPELLRCALVLMAPDDTLKLGGCDTYAKLADHRKRFTGPTREALLQPPCRLGNVIIRMPMANYPERLDRVERCESGLKPSGGAERSHWKIEARRRPKSTKQSDTTLV